MKLGGHVSTAGGLSKSIGRAQTFGANCMQIFPSSPRSFRAPDQPDEEITDFCRLVKSSNIGPIFFHGVYLINLAAESEPLYKLSIESLVSCLKLCEILPIEGVIFHIGSHKGKGFSVVRDKIFKAVEMILDRTAAGKLILENSAGQGGGVGSRFEEISDIINYIKSPRLAVCLDSQHAFAAGYPVQTQKGLEETLARFDETVGLKNLVAVHLNDSKFPLGSLRDRHENIGRGLIGLEGIGRIVNHHKIKQLPFILEVPGFKHEGPDKKNLDLLKKLIITD